MDPFDEFEFKPITDGLGFHKKKTDDVKNISLSRDLVSKSDLPESIPEGLLEEEMPEPRNQAEAYKDLMRTLSQNMDEDEEAAPKEELELSQPLPRKSDAKKADIQAVTESAFEVEFPDMSPSEVPAMTEMPDIIEESNDDKTRKEVLKDSTAQRGASNSPKLSHLIEAPVSFSSAILDFVLVIALAGVFLVSLLLVTQVQLDSVIFSLKSDIFARVSMLVLLVAVMQMYVVVSRSFFGRTLGEWTFDHQMGTESDMESPMYPVKIVWRSLFTVITGVFFMPFLSFVFRRDLSAKVTGVQLYRQR